MYGGHTRVRGTLRHIKEVRIKLDILCNTVKGTAHALASLDRSFAAIFTGDNPSLTFSFWIAIGPRLFEGIRKVVPNPLQLLEEKGRLILEFDDNLDNWYLELLKDSKESDVSGDTDSEHESEDDEESDTTPQ
ncbi:uncharacterized protein PHACADRAFT_209721 [Phanerochaete carnosa HHB-10118-sp]|uniref:Uncharacterized protein n=1 Tax=Phanerochaete carnosa (strain HHB-10118-sp) TaxID=650164 RepID=K5WTX6_PHACS|nr:uncharacterized protein PHACADRAFT_209721 [Phanerochaete carnosa HHB-10118-sp]EKM53872.1 hypothetical protein PHACADRAFT_209721 [Phanerochaete carnosa HHB-10118-sp]